MAKYISANEYLELVKDVMGKEWFDGVSHHPEDIEIAVEFASKAVFTVLKALDKPA